MTPQACLSQIGSGALPVQNIPSFGLAITASSDAQLRALSDAFRQLPVQWWVVLMIRNYYSIYVALIARLSF